MAAELVSSDRPIDIYARVSQLKRNEKRDERLKIPLDPETALHALLAVKPDDEPPEDQPTEDEKAERSGK